MAFDWNHDGKITPADRAVDYAVYQDIYGDDNNGGGGKDPKGGGGCGCGTAIGIFLVGFIIWSILS